VVAVIVIMLRLAPAFREFPTSPPWGLFQSKSKKKRQSKQTKRQRKQTKRHEKLCTCGFFFSFFTICIPPFSDRFLSLSASCLVFCRRSLPPSPPFILLCYFHALRHYLTSSFSFFLCTSILCSFLNHPCSSSPRRPGKTPGRRRKGPWPTRRPPSGQSSTPGSGQSSVRREEGHEIRQGEGMGM